ncbi:MAG: NAD-dependent epimerase/dehydratase family protein, partial [Nitrospinota bacterium]
YGFHKAECERLLAAEPASRFPWSILRLPAVYGPGDPISREHFFARRILAGRPILLPEGGRFLCQNIFVEDVAEACCRLLVSPRAVGRAYNVGASPFTLAAYLQLAGELLGRSVSVVQVGMDFLEEGGMDPTGIPYVFDGDLVLKTTRLAEEVGFRPSVTLEEGLARTFEWLATGPAVEDHHWGLPFGAEDRILRAANGGQPRPAGAGQG